MLSESGIVRVEIGSSSDLLKNDHSEPPREVKDGGNIIIIIINPVDESVPRTYKDIGACHLS